MGWIWACPAYFNMFHWIQHRFNIFQHLRRGFHRCFKPKSLLNALTLTKRLRRLSNNTTDWVYGRQMSPRKKSKNCSTYPPYIYTTSAGAPVAASFRIPEKVVASADSAHYEVYGKIYRVNGSKKGKLFSKYKTIEHATAMWRMWCQPRINEPEAVDLGGGHVSSQLLLFGGTTMMKQPEVY